MRNKLLAGVVTALSVLIAPAAALATSPGRNGEIAFNRPGPDGPHGESCEYGCVYAVAPDGTGERLLAAGAQDPAFSPTGLLGYASDTYSDLDTFGIFVAAADGSGARMLFHGQSGGPVFSPNGKRVAFDDDHGHIRVLGLQSGKLITRFRLRFPIYKYSWGAGGRLAITRDVQDYDECSDSGANLRDIYTVTSNGRGWRRLTRNYGSQDPDWSPNGKRIAFTRDTSVGPSDRTRARAADSDCKVGVGAAGARRGNQIWVMSASGGHPRRLTSGPEDSDPVWSPDGRRIAFMRRGFICVMNADGSHVRRVAEGKTPAWQPLH